MFQYQRYYQQFRSICNSVLLFGHAFTGCDSTSVIYKYGKIAILKKINDSDHLKILATEFYNNNKLPEDIGNTATASLNIYIHQLVVLWHNQERKNMMKCQITHISILPPSPRAAFFHGTRIYHQIKVWCCLSNIDIEPLNWGWEMKDESLIPLLTDEEPCPQELLQIIRCSCKESCGKQCSCQKAGMK